MVALQFEEEQELTMENTFNQTAPQVGAINELIIAKVVTMCALGGASFLVGMLPVYLKRLIPIQTSEQDKHLTLSLLLCFGGGVLLFTTFLHLQPEVRESFARLESENKIPTIGYGISTSELVFCLGFFFVYLIEELIHSCLDKKMKHDVLHRSLSVRCRHVHTHGDHLARTTDIGKKEDAICANNQNDIEQDSKSGNLNDTIKTSFSGLLTVLALSFHAIFEGLAVGLENGTQKVWYLLIAIATHKLVIAFCVGVELVTSKTKLLLMSLYIGTFAVVTPLGQYLNRQVFFYTS